MCIRCFALAAFISVAILGLAGCGSGTWATVENQGCASETVAQLNETAKSPLGGIVAGGMGDAVCKRAGKQFAGKFRCHGQELQAACK